MLECSSYTPLRNRFSVPFIECYSRMILQKRFFGYRDTLSYRIDGPRPTALIIHPFFPNQNRVRCVYDAIEALYLVRCAKWDILPGMSSPYGGFNQALLDELEAKRDGGNPDDRYSNIRSDDEESDHENDMDDDLWNHPVSRWQYAESLLLEIGDINLQTFLPNNSIKEISMRISLQPPKYIFLNTCLTAVQCRNLEYIFHSALLAFRAQKKLDDRFHHHLRNRVGRTVQDSHDVYETNEENFKVDFIEVIDRQRMVLEAFSARSVGKGSYAEIQLAIARMAYLRVNMSMKTIGRNAEIFKLLADHRIPFKEVPPVRDGVVWSISEAKREDTTGPIRDELRRLRMKLRRIRAHRKKRRRARGDIFVVALVGYTNVGKTSLLRQLLNDADTSVGRSRDMFFETIDVDFKFLRLPSGIRCFLVDTVGFIKDIPHYVFDTYQICIEEFISCDIVLHIRDISSEMCEAQKTVVNKALLDGGFTRSEIDAKTIEVWNKIDSLDGEEFASIIESNGYKEVNPVLVSSKDRTGIDILLHILDAHATKGKCIKRFTISISLDGSVNVGTPLGVIGGRNLNLLPDTHRQDSPSSDSHHLVNHVTHNYVDPMHIKPMSDIEGNSADSGIFPTSSFCGMYHKVKSLSRFENHMKFLCRNCEVVYTESIKQSEDGNTIHVEVLMTETAIKRYMKLFYSEDLSHL